MSMDPTEGGVHPSPGPGGVGDVQFYLASPPCYPYPQDTNFVNLLLEPGTAIPHGQDTVVATFNQPVGADNYAWIYFTTDRGTLTPQYQHFIQIATDGEFLITSVGGPHDDQSTPQNPSPSGCHGDINTRYDQDRFRTRRIIWSFGPLD
jgi:hypothetical protein